MSTHQLAKHTNVGDPIIGIPRYVYDEGMIVDVRPMPSPGATRACSCGLMIVAPTDAHADESYARHQRLSGELRDDE